MRTVFKQTVNRTDLALDRFSHIINLTRVLRGLLLAALFCVPAHGFSSVPPPTYSPTLQWQGSSDPAIAGYRIYYWAQDGSYSNSVTVGNATTTTLSGLASGVTYFFEVTAYNGIGVESVPSNEITYTPGIQAVNLNITPAGARVLAISGVLNHTYEIQATQDFKTWTTIGTVMIGISGLLSFTDLNAASNPSRFYRTHDLQL